MNSPATWLTSHSDLLTASGAALDLACGSGRHALWLAERGYTTTAVDRDPAAIDSVSREAARRGLSVQAVVIDVESDRASLEADSFDVIVVVYYLHRPLFPSLVAALKRGGVLVYETFTRAQAARGKPTNPAFLLETGELARLVQPLQIVRSREGDYDGRMVASVIATKA